MSYFFWIFCFFVLFKKKQNKAKYPISFRFLSLSSHFSLAKKEVIELFSTFLFSNCFVLFIFFFDLSICGFGFDKPFKFVFFIVFSFLKNSERCKKKQILKNRKNLWMKKFSNCRKKFLLFFAAKVGFF